MSTSLRRQENFVTRSAPALLTLLVTLITAVPISLFSSSGVTPAFTLICIFYWCVYLPDALPYVFLFLLGILQDALSGTPLGLSSLINVGVAYLLHTQRGLMGRAQFGAVWMGCMLLVAMATMTQWSVMCLYSGKAYDFTVPLMSWVLTCIAYPPLHLLLTQVYKRIRVR